MGGVSCSKQEHPHGAIICGESPGKFPFYNLILRVMMQSNHHFRSVATSHILSKHNRLYTCTRTCIIILHNLFYFSSCVATVGAPIDSATWLPVCWTRVVQCSCDVTLSCAYHKKSNGMVNLFSLIWCWERISSQWTLWLPNSGVATLGHAGARALATSCCAPPVQCW